MWTKSETCTWLDNNIRLENVVLKYKTKIKIKYYLQVAIHKNENKMQQWQKQIKRFKTSVISSSLKQVFPYSHPIISPHSLQLYNNSPLHINCRETEKQVRKKTEKK